ncbi:hypothetical protein Ae201684_008004 [Aphanomyces euteiches]|uniref:Uncharacterized protein n=1 Tax=Aphanomyces euteiches TaxID=100861 RepID=A0A6G0X6B9_9STRA|nr:hypothetical protein Ae201684_008004 [Aphanomyces euteiches]KAH9136899.1 hypothetical protein AeRB84_018145 [Aphanomyces euteiches]
MQVGPEAIAKPTGLTLSFFKRFVDLHGGRDAFQGLTTGDVCSKYLLPYTASTKLSLVEHLRQQPDGHLHVKPATWFVSHAWSYRYLDVVDALDDFFQEQGMDDSVALWFCTFCNNQHEIESQIHSFDYWFGIFRHSLREIGSVVMVMSPWNDPTTLKRTWCVFEVYASIVENARFEIAFGRSQKESFLQDIQNDGAFKQMLGTINSEKSETTEPTDRDRIFELIEEEVGFTKLDRMIFEALVKWMVRMVDQQIEQATSQEAKADWLFTKGHIADTEIQKDVAVDSFQKSYEIYRQEKGLSFPGTWKALAELGRSKMLQDRSLEEAESLCLEALNHQIELLSKDHEDTLVTMNYLGACYIYHGKLDTALPLLLDCFERQCRHIGEDHVRTIGTMSQLGDILRLQGKLKEALGWITRCYQAHSRVFGEEHPETYCYRHNLGVVCNAVGDFVSGENHILSSCEAFERMLGPRHKNTVDYRISLGDSYRRQAKYEQAKATFHWCLSLETLDPQQKECCLRILGYTYFATKEYDNALKYVNLGLEHLASLGSSYGRRALYLPPLYFLKKKTGKFNELDEIETFINALREVNWTQDVWKTWTCHGCFLEIHGMIFTCAQCPAFSLRFCQSCVELNKQEAFCNHGKDLLESDKPPMRFLQEQRLELLAANSTTDEYDSYYSLYIAYCDENQVPFNQRLPQAMPTDVNRETQVQSCCNIL